jgi:hypothetical protein
VSCRWPDFDVESEIADAIVELGGGTGWVTPGEMVGAEILITSAVGEHVVGGGEDRGGDGDNSFFGAAACFQPQELRLKVAVLLASRGPGTLNQHRLQPWGAFSDAGRAPLAGTLVEARDETRLGQQMTRRWKLPHVDADLGEEGLGRGLAQTRNLLQSFKGVTKGLERGLDPRVEGRNRLFQLLNGL